MRHRVLPLLLCLLATLVLLPGLTPVTAQDGGVSANLTDSCVEHYDPAVDYFPDKASFDYASGLRVEYFNHYRVVSVLPWQDADAPFQYLLVQCGTPAPDGYPDAQMITTPIDRLVTLSTSYLPHLAALGVEDTLAAHDEFDYINTPSIRARIDDGALVEVGSGSAINVEQVLDLQPDVVMTYGSGFPEYDAHPALLEAGITTLLTSEYLETQPLGQAEWLKLTAMLYNREADANTVFEGIAQRYNDLKALAATVEERPTVLVNTPFGGTWFIAGGRSTLANLLADAGADYPWADDDSAGSLQLSFEEVLDTAIDAEVWVNIGFWNTLADGLAEDERYALFSAFEAGDVWAYNLRVNEFGGNDYFETGAANPDLVLADLIAIFHPALLPGHEFMFYRRLE